MIWKACFLVAALAAGTASAGMLMGGFSNAKITDQGVEDAMQFALGKHNEGTNDMFLRQVARVIKVEKQVCDFCM